MTKTTTNSYTRSQRLLEYASIASFGILTIVSLQQLIHAGDRYFIAIALTAVIVAWLLVDLLSGVLHFMLDSWGNVHTPLIGNTFIRPFREHHVNPKEMTHHDFVELNGASCFACLPLLGFSLTIQLTSNVSVFFQTLILCISLSALVTNECHKWAHTEATLTPYFILLAQRYRLILPPEQHALHHTTPFNSHFCMTNGWLNKSLNFWLSLWK